MEQNVENVDIDEPTSFLDHESLEYTQRECNPNEIIVDQYKEMLESRISAGATDKLPGAEKPHEKTVAWSYGVEGHAQTCVEGYCELAQEKDRGKELYKLSSPCLQICPQFVLKFLCFIRIGRPNIIWSVDKFARSVTKWTQTCDRRLARPISYIHRTSDYQ